MPDLAGYCWWFCWKHIFIGDDEHILADICRYLQMNLESRQKNNNKKHRTFIFLMVKFGLFVVKPQLFIVKFKVVDKPNLIRQCVSGSNVSMGIYGNVGRGGFNMFQPCSASPPRCSFLKLPFWLVLLSQSGLHHFLVGGIPTPLKNLSSSIGWMSS